LGLPAFLVGVTRQLAGQAFRFNLFIGEKPLKSISAAILNAHLANYILSKRSKGFKPPCLNNIEFYFGVNF